MFKIYSMRKVELLAPCGDFESLQTAINNGADAVYLGLGDFNARAKSTYFTVDNIRENIKLAHLYGVKVYITINTLVTDDEMPQFLELVKACVLAKADAFIVQDFGCAYLLKNLFPNIELHASTQMGIHNVDGAKFAKELGFTRVVLSREVSLFDIKQIKKETSLEIEYFVQGALCVAFSGNCYFSALEHEQSGNRGKCLQLCRLPYDAYLENEKIGSGYLLSARDLCLMPNIEKLIEAGVDSFKIEGRLRRPGYVAQSVSSYRKAIDSITNKLNFDMNAEINKLKRVFSRGEFNYSAYLENNDKIINKLNQNHTGIEIGKIIKAERFKDLFKVTIKTNHEITAGDGLKFFNNLGAEVDSLGVGNVEKISKDIYTIYTKHKLSNDLIVNLTLDKNLEENALKNIRKINLNLSFSAKQNQPFVVNINYQNLSLKYTSKYTCQTALNQPTKVEEIKEIFSNLDTNYFNTNIENVNLENVFIPKSALKQARRELSEITKDFIIENYEKQLNFVTIPQDFNTYLSKSPNLTADFNNIIIINENNELDKINILENDLLAFQPENWNLENIKNTLDKLNNYTNNLALVLPTIANQNDLKIIDEIIKKLDNNIYLILGNIYGLKYTNTHKLIAGIDMNIYNKYSILNLQNLGVKQFIWSKEIKSNLNEVYEFTYGHQALMHLAHCPFKTLFNNSCANCKFNKNLVYKANNGEKYEIHRTKITKCYFTLYQNKLTNKIKSCNNVLDLRY